MLLRRCCPGGRLSKVGQLDGVWVSSEAWPGCENGHRGDARRVVQQPGEPGWNRDFSRAEFNSRSRPHSPGRRQQLVPEIRLFVWLESGVKLSTHLAPLSNGNNTRP